MHGNPLLADWVTKHIGDGWITELMQLARLVPYASDAKAQKEFMEIKRRNKVRLAEYIKEHNGIEVDPDSIFDVQVKRLHEYKRQFLNILHVMYLYNELKANPQMDFYPRTFIFGAKAAAGYRNAKLTIKLINSVADVINNDADIKGKIKVVFIEDYRVSNAEWIFAAADVSEQDVYKRQGLYGAEKGRLGHPRTSRRAGGREDAGPRRQGADRAVRSGAFYRAL